MPLQFRVWGRAKSGPYPPCHLVTLPALTAPCLPIWHLVGDPPPTIPVQGVRAGRKEGRSRHSYRLVLRAAQG